MAEKTEKKAEEKPAPAPAAAHGGEKKAGGSLFKSTPSLLAVVMVVEAAVLFAAVKMFGGQPKSAQGAELVTEAAEGHGGGHGSGEATAGKGGDAKQLVEVNVLDFKTTNKLTGRTFLYDVSIFVLSKADHKEKVKSAIEAREATIKDRIRTVIAQCDPEKLGGGSEPGLETLRRQVKYELDEILGEGLIERVLVPKCIPYRAEF